MNPRFFSEGSNHHVLIERELLEKEKFITKWELSFLAFDKEFLTSAKEKFGNDSVFTYKLSWRKKSGQYSNAKESKNFKTTYKSVELGEVSANSIEELLQKAAAFKPVPSKIQETETFRMSSDVALLVEEQIKTEFSSYIWQHDLGETDKESSTLFQSLLQTNGSPKQSPNYEYSQNRFEILSSEPNKLFYKQIYSDSKTSVFFVPPLANALSVKPGEPVGLRRIGNFLLKEEK